MSPTFWKKKKSKNKKKTALYYYYYYFHSINLAKIVSRHLVPKNDLGEISLKRKKKKEKGVFYQQVYVYEREWCKTIYSWSISIFAFDPRSTRFSRLRHWSLGRVRRFCWTHPELETSISLLLSSLIFDISIVSCSEACILGLTFTGGLSTGTATYTGDWRPLTADRLLLVKRVVSLAFVLNFAKGGLILSIALGVCNKKKQTISFKSTSNHF